MTSRYRVLADAEWATGHHDYDIAVVLLQRALEQAPADSELCTELCDAHEEKAAWIAQGIKAAGGNVEGVVSREIGRSLGELARIDKARADRLRQGLRERLKASDPLLDEWVAASAATQPDAMARSLRDGATPESSSSQLHCCALLLLGTADRPLAANEGIATGDRLDEDFLIARTVALLRAEPSLVPTFARYIDHCADLAGPWPDHSFTAAQRFAIVAWRSSLETLIVPALEGHLRLCVQLTRKELDTRPQPDKALARKFVDQGKSIVEKLKTKGHIDPGLEADLLMVDGQTSFHEDPDSLLPALASYRRSLALKKTAAAAETAQVAGSLRRMVENVVARHYATARQLSRYGNAAPDLEAALDAAREIGDEDLAARIGLALVRRYALTSQHENAEKLARSLLAEPPVPPLYRNDLRFELAVAICWGQSVVFGDEDRTTHPGARAEACRIFEDLLNDDDWLHQWPSGRSTLLLNLGSVVARSGDDAKSCEFYRAALAALPSKDAKRAEIELKVRGSLCASLMALGDPDGARRELDRSIELLAGLPPGPERLQIARNLGHIAVTANLEEPALALFAIARSELREALLGCRDAGAWNALLAYNVNLDTYSVEILCRRSDDASRLEALQIAEESKARRTRWLYRYFQSGLKARELGFWESLRREEREAFEGVEAWIKGGTSRYAVSLFHATFHRGLCVIVMQPSGAVHSKWFPEIDDKQMTTDLARWQATLARIGRRDSSEWSEATRTLEDMLDAVGSWIVATCPVIAEGGEAMLISPHRHLRMLPLAHARVPNGARLAELFTRVHIVPAFGELHGRMHRTDMAADDPPAVVALANPDGTLPFAQMEAYCCAGLNGTHPGARATRRRLREAFIGQNPVLLSCHARFNANDPLNSYFQLADGRERLEDLLLLIPRECPPIVVLAACEGARARDTVTDEPDGFAPILFMRGLDAVMAPLWRVDDLSSYLFMTQFFDLLRATDPAPAAQQAAAWLRNLTPGQALLRVNRAVDRLGEVAETVSIEEQAHLENALARARGWLSRTADRLPFASALDWAAYQLVSAPGHRRPTADEMQPSRRERRNGR